VREERVLVQVPSGLVVPVYPPSLVGDRDADGRVDAFDMAACDACVGRVFTAPCAAFDADGDCAVTATDRLEISRRLCDLDRDGGVGPQDLALLLAGWARPDLDLTGDFSVGPADVAVMLANWSS
jgi:hypothetical protein